MKTQLRKTASLLIATLAAALLLAGCMQSSGSYSLINYGEDSGDGYWEMEYEYFDGYKQKKISLNGEPFFMLADFTTLSGSLRVIVSGANEVYYDGVVTTDTNITVEAPSEKSITIRVEAEDHEGSFYFDWG